MKIQYILLLIFIPTYFYGQSYTSYQDGNTTDLLVNPQGGVCLMGGASESDEAMQWFLQRANGGDVLVLRASGSDGYNDYFYNQLGVTINSVETIVFHDAAAANENYIHEKIAKAEAIWLAGGDQWNYISYWRNTAIDSLINDGLQNRNMVIGGTSAGMAILGSHYFSAENGTITSTTALNNPYDVNLTVDSNKFISIPILNDVITDTHYDNPDRKGRHITFLARMFQDYNSNARGIACDEFTAVCIDENGIARAFGDFPNYDDNVYFLQVNCENSVATPEIITSGQPLDWNLGGDAIKVYTMKGTTTGSNTFDLNTWETGNGGNWENWSVTNGVLNEVLDSAIDCTIPANLMNLSNQFEISPNPVTGNFINIETNILNINQIEIIDINGRIIKNNIQNTIQSIDVSDLKQGVYFINIYSERGRAILKFIKI